MACHVPIDITVSSSITVLGIDDAEDLVSAPAFVTIAEGGEIVNRGTTHWPMRMSWGRRAGRVVGSSGL